MTEINLTPEQAARVALQAMATAGLRDDWYRCTYRDGSLHVPDDLAALVAAIDPDVTPPEVLPVPPSLDGPTLSDWRVALIQMGRFSEVKAAIQAARETGSVEGLIAWERFEYANHVYRAELLRLAPLMGFSEADIDQSLTVAAQVAAAAS